MQTDIPLSEPQITSLFSTQPRLPPQFLTTDLSLHSPEISSRQPTLNIITTGHHSHGKTTLIHSLLNSFSLPDPSSSSSPASTSLSFTNIKLFKCLKCPQPECYKSFPSSTPSSPKCPTCNEPLTLLRHMCFIDSASHEHLMSFILTSNTIIDGALHLIAVNETFPQLQSQEQLTAMTKMDVKHITIVQNKMDTNISDETLKHQFKQIQTFVAGTTASTAHVVPISAKLKYNIDVVIQLLSHIPQPKRDLLSPPRCIVLKSIESNINSVIDNNNNVNCVIASAMLIKGVINLGQVVEVKPGVITKTQSNEIKVTPIYTHVIALYSEDNTLLYAVPGGLVRIALRTEQTLMKAEKLNGRVIGAPGKLPDVVVKIVVRCCLLKRLMNVKRKDGDDSVGEVKLHEMLLVSVNACSVGGKVVEINGNEVMFELNVPICCEIREKVAVSRKIGKNVRLIGFGEVISTVTIDDSDI